MNYLRQLGALIFGTALAGFGLQYCFSATSLAVPVTGKVTDPSRAYFDAADGVPRGLRAVAHDGDFGADEG